MKRELLWYAHLPLPVILRLKSVNPGVSIAEKEIFLSGIKHLDLSAMNLSAVPPFIKDMVNLQYLDLSDNFIECRLDGSEFPSSLRSLKLDNNELTEFSFEGFSDIALANLNILYLERNHLSAVPIGLHKATKLYDLNLRGNQIKNLRGFVAPPKLSLLNLADNGMESMEIESGALGQCLRLNLANNKLKSIPASVFELTSLKYLDIKENDLEDWNFLTPSLLFRMRIDA